MVFKNQRGFSQIFLLVFLLTGLLVALYLVQKKTNVLPKAVETPQNYIVVLNDDVISAQDTAFDIAQKQGLVPGEVYSTALKGFAIKATRVKLDKIKQDSRVRFVSEDKEVKAAAPRPKPPSVTQQTIPTGVTRIGANNLTNKGTQVGVAVLDTGIELKHADLKTNILMDKSCISGVRTGNDDNGHGTAVAGVIAALNNNIGVRGVAPEVKLLAVKVLNSTATGSWSSVICGIDWAVANSTNYNIKVLNLSLGGGGTSDNNCGNSNFDALHLALCRAKDAGLTIVTSAGNDGLSTSGFVPAAYDEVITVSALADSDGLPGGAGPDLGYGVDDSFGSFSNFGTEVDLGAPGVSINTTYLNGGYSPQSGTSVSAPHVAGAAALYLKNNPNATFIEVKNALISAAEVAGSGHTDPSGNHPEPVVNASSF